MCGYADVQMVAGYMIVSIEQVPGFIEVPIAGYLGINI